MKYVLCKVCQYYYGFAASSTYRSDAWSVHWRRMRVLLAAVLQNAESTEPYTADGCRLSSIHVHSRMLRVLKRMRLHQKFLTVPVWNATRYVHVDACGMARMTFCSLITLCEIVWFWFCRTVIRRPRRSKELSRTAAETHVMTLRSWRQRDCEYNAIYEWQQFPKKMMTRCGADFQLRDTIPWLCRRKALSVQIVDWPYGKLQKKL